MKKFFVALIVVLLCSSLITAFATENIAEPQMVLPTELDVRESIAGEKYNKLLSFWSENSGYISDTAGVFPEFYGGAHLNDDKNLVIQVTSLNNDVVSYFGETIDLTDVEFQQVEYSYNRLKDEHEAIVTKMELNPDDAFISCISGVGISTPNNSINLYIAPLPERATENDVFYKR